MWRLTNRDHAIEGEKTLIFLWLRVNRSTNTTEIVNFICKHIAQKNMIR